MKKIVSGITATGRLTLGNYIGALRNFIALQDQYKMYIFVADLHALASQVEVENINLNKRQILALYLACGLDPKRTTLFYQSDVSAHGTMAWVMENQTTIGELSRMTQFKDKAKVKEANKTEKIRTGLLTYPALMAGDILLYDAELVPVGVDQKQHLELTRNIAERFNNKYGPTFVIPEPYIPPLGNKIYSLSNPLEKMSKSSNDTKGTIYLLDDPKVAKQKVMKAVTDSDNIVRYDVTTKPGVSNLMTIYAALKNLTLAEVEIKFADQNYGVFKEAVANVVAEFLTKLQTEYQKWFAKVDEVARQGQVNANKQANTKLNEVLTKIKLR